MARIRDLMGTGNSAESAKAIAGKAGAITAAGTTAAAATVLGFETNNVTTAGGADAVVLPTSAQGSQPGDTCYVLNLASTTAQLFCAATETLNGATSAVSVAQNKMAVCKKFTNSAWGVVVTG